MLAGVCVLLFAGPAFMIHCLARVNIAVDSLEVVGVLASYHHDRVLRAKVNPIVLWVCVLVFT